MKFFLIKIGYFSVIQSYLRIKKTPERVADHPGSFYHSNISLEIIILPFFMIIFLFPSISSTIEGYIPVIMIISINYYD